MDRNTIVVVNLDPNPTSSGTAASVLRIPVYSAKKESGEVKNVTVKMPDSMKVVTAASERSLIRPRPQTP
eukprot:CAMPEP_0176291068 /NCGR_PEP_ID=MMETSP0121_2-20121125/55354_1 /TAXON_ID=160619 /ORGANISM="Kryptoperidinium foliaceum, Strain CCMP 1326" /LENGTH=69 /DNA_ID=CAMNT_0017631891 /DNA_START=269 /DNA_END=478 /DNA_ORIENTATION=+